jgi:hypothetical protein
MANTFKNAKLKVQDTASDVYTAPALTTAIVIGCQVANVSATNEEVSVWWTDASDSNAITRLVEDLIIPPKVAIGVTEGKLVLEAGDKIRVQGQTNDDAEITVSVLEIS